MKLRAIRMRAASLIALSGTLLAAKPAYSADPKQGEVLAEHWCSACHVVSANQKQGNTEAPPFSEIADSPNFDGAKLAFLLLAPHPPMSGINLSRNEAADLAAYIATRASR